VTAGLFASGVISVSYRRRRDAWDDFLKFHGSELLECGLPAYLIRDKMRFLVFLDHGYDEWGWYYSRHAFFDATALTDEQIQRLSQIVGDYIDEGFRQVIASRWARSYYAQ
jgi:hypothetical protein